MKTVLIEELIRINTLMGNNSIDHLSIFESINKSQILNEGGPGPAGLIERLLQLAEKNLKNKDDLYDILKYLDEAADEKVKLPEIDPLTGTKASRARQLELLAEELGLDAESIAAGYRSEMTIEGAFEKLYEMAKKAANSATNPVKMTDPEVMALLTKLEKTTFDTDAGLLMLYNNSLGEVTNWIKNQPVGETLTEEQILAEFEKRLTKRLEDSIKGSGYKITDDVYKEMILHYKNKFKTKPSGKTKSPLLQAIEDADRPEIISNTGKEKIRPQTVVAYGLGVNFFEVKTIFKKLLDSIESLRKGKGWQSSIIINQRMENRINIFKSLSPEQIISETGDISEACQTLIRGHISDMKSIRNVEKDIIKYWEEFIDELNDLPGWKPVADKIQNVLLYEGVGTFGIKFNDVSISKYMDEVADIMLKNPTKDKYGVITGERVNQFIQIYRQLIYNFRGLFKDFSSAKKAADEVKQGYLKKVTSAAKNFPIQRILSGLTFYTLFTPRQIAFLMFSRGLNAQSILVGYFSTYFMVLFWKKCMKSVYAGAYYFVSAILEAYKTDEDIKYTDLFLNELKQIWGLAYDGANTILQNDLLKVKSLKVKEIKNFKGISGEKEDFYFPIDIRGGVWPSLFGALFDTFNKSAADKDAWVMNTYEESTKKVWDNMDETSKITVLETIAINTLEDFPYFSKLSEKTKSFAYQQMVESNNITPSDVEIIRKSRIGKVPIDGTSTSTRLKELVRKYSSSTATQDEIDKMYGDIVKQTKVGAFMAPNGALYEIFRETDNTLDKVFKFRPLSFDAFYGVDSVKLPGKGKGYKIYFDEKIDTKPIALEKKDITNKGISVDNYNVDDSGFFKDKKNAEDVMLLLQSKLPKSEPSTTVYTMKEFANILKNSKAPDIK
jgi:hypothetical protein